MRDYECDCCNKGLVELPGQWCSECQEREHYAQLESDGRWLSESRKCQQCSNAWGGDSSDRCDAYNMPLWMVARKKKCKHFSEIDWSKVHEEVAWY